MVSEHAPWWKTASALVKCFDDIAADKAGRACYDNGHNEFPLF